LGRGETFSGLDYEGLQAVETLRPLLPPNCITAQMALRWILMFPAVTCAIPGRQASRTGGGEYCGYGFAAAARCGDDRNW